jgi:hypothetical protein
VHLVARPQQRQVVVGPDMGDDRRIVGSRQAQPHDRALEGQIGDGGGNDGEFAGRRGRDLHDDADPFRSDHQGRLAPGFDGGGARRRRQLGAQHLDLDQILTGGLAGAAGLAAVPQVGLADEAGDEHGRGPVVDLGRSADLLDVAGVHDRDAVTHRQRLLLIVGDVDERDAELTLDALELELHDVTQFEVQRTERFVEQQGARIVDQGAGQGDALLLAAGQLRGLALREIRQADDLEQFVDAALDLVFSFWNCAARTPRCPTRSCAGTVRSAGRRC